MTAIARRVHDRTRPGPPRWLADTAVASVAALATAACAVMEIDVDVYKGPLFNDESVQVEQAAVMAVAAKPLLIQLRDRLEVTGPTSVSKDDGDLGQRLLKLRRMPGYEADWVRAGLFTDERARFLNGVLYLYKDEGEAELGPALAQARAALDDYEAARAILNTPPGPDLATRLEASAYEDVRGAAAPPTRFTEEVCPDGFDLLKDLRRRYEDLLRLTGARQFNAAAHIVQIHRCLLRATPAVRDTFRKSRPDLPAALPAPEIGGRKLDALAGPPFVDAVRSFDAVYRVLSDQDLLDTHARLLLPADQREDLVARVARAATAWARARSALERLQQASLSLLDCVGSQTPARSESPAAGPTRAPASSTHASMCGIGAGERRERLAQLAARTVQPTLFTMVLEQGDLPPVLVQVREDLKVHGVLNSTGMRDHPLLTPNDDRIVREVLARALTDRTPEMVVALRAASARVKSSTFTSGNMVSFALPESRMYGLAEVPYRDPQDVLAFDFSTYEKTAIEAGVGLERGRLPDGLETLITRYLQETHKAMAAGPLGLDPSSPHAAARRQLLAALAGFAQKVLFQGNFAGLVTDGDVGDLRPYVFLLQAVGNAILTQVDELQRSVTHQLDQRDRAARVEAIARTTVWDRFRDARISAGRPAAVDGAKPDGAAATAAPCPPLSCGPEPTEAKFEFDRVIAELRHLYVNAVAGGPGDAAKLLDALGKAYEQRSRMLYLRPAAAYLRNSYPVTSLQRDSAATWSNMLSDHVLRQFGYDRPGGPKALQRTVQEFDKQYWQSVNRVRLAGAGRTNYVIAKDDVGNWYVKNYSSNPETIIRGAKALALFAANGAVSAGALNRAHEQIAKGADASIASPGAAPDSGAQQLLRDQRKTAADRDATDTAVLLARIRGDWQAARLRSVLDETWIGAGITATATREVLSFVIDRAEPQCALPATATVAGDLGALVACRNALAAGLETNALSAEIDRRVGLVTALSKPAAASMTRAESSVADVKSQMKTAGESLAQAVAKLNDAESNTGEATLASARASAQAARAEVDKARGAVQTASQNAQEASRQVEMAATGAGQASTQATAVRVSAQPAQDAAAKTVSAKAATEALGKAVGEASGASASITKELDDADAALSAAAVRIAEPTATAEQRSQALETARAALRKARTAAIGAQEAARHTETPVATAEMSTDEAVKALGLVGTPPATPAVADIDKARQAAQRKLNDVATALVSGRDSILKEHGDRLKAIIQE